MKEINRKVNNYCVSPVAGFYVLNVELTIEDDDGSIIYLNGRYTSDSNAIETFYSTTSVFDLLVEYNAIDPDSNRFDEIEKEVDKARFSKESIVDEKYKEFQETIKDIVMDEFASDDDSENYLDETDFIIA